LGAQCANAYTVKAGARLRQAGKIPALPAMLAKKKPQGHLKKSNG
jgi:hypothetical protein